MPDPKIPVTRAPAGGKGLALDEKGLAPSKALGSGTADSTTFLRGDRNWAAPPAGGSPPTGTGFRHVTAGAEDAASKLVDTADVNNDQITFAKLVNIATSRFLGRISGGSGDPEELTGTQATTLLDLFTSTLKGLVPASGGGTTTFLRADGTFAAPAAASPLTTKGDVYTHDATVDARLPVGTNTHVLTADSAQALGVKWAAPAGGAPVLTLVEKSLLASPAARRNGSFQITGLSGLTVDQPVYIQQANGPYTGKGTRQDEAEMDQLTVTAKVLSATAIQCYWESNHRVRGNFKFSYFVGG
jgi:hypothetical protein